MKKGEKMSQEQKDMQSNTMKGSVPWNKGKTGVYSKESLDKMSSVKIGKRTGEKNGMYGKPSNMKGKRHTEESRKKMSLVTLGEKNSMYGKKRPQEYINKSVETRLRTAKRLGYYFSEETLGKLSLAKLRNWKEESYVKMQRAALKRKPTKPELFLNDFLQRYFPNEWKYVGDFRFWIDGKNPDFINCNGKKLIIEYNGFYTHTKEKDERKSAHYLQYGFKTLNLYEEDLKNESKLSNLIEIFSL